MRKPVGREEEAIDMLELYDSTSFFTKCRQIHNPTRQLIARRGLSELSPIHAIPTPSSPGA
jgi:hypothetical protein